MFEAHFPICTDLRTILRGLNAEKSGRGKNSGTALGKVFHFDLSKRELGLRPALGIDRSEAIPNGHETFRQHFLQMSKLEQDMFTRLCSSLGTHPQQEDPNYSSEEVENVGNYFYGHILVIWLRFLVIFSRSKLHPIVFTE